MIEVITVRGDILEYNDDFKRRRAYISSCEKMRKRKRTVLITILLLVLAVLLLGIGAGFFIKKNGGLPGFSKKNAIETSSDSSDGESINLSLAESGSRKDGSSETPASTAESYPYNTGDTALNDILISAHAKFVTYDYDAAIDLLNSNPDYAENPDVKELLASCEETKATLVRADVTKITHIFFHSLIMDNSKAFDGDSDEKGYNQVMTTKSEFLKILDSMYAKGYVLVKLHDIAHEETDESGNARMVPGTILLPPGKIPFVMSQDDLCYYEYMTGDGFASRMIVGEDGKPTCEMVMDDGSVSVGSYDLVPLLEDFITEHPDFSYRGARAVLAFTGYQGVLGYRTDPSYESSNPNYEADKETVRQVAQCLRDNGWELASHSWGHINFGKRSFEDVKTDSDKWASRVESLIGKTDILLYPFGSDVGDWHPYTSENQKYEYLHQLGFRYFCNVDSSQHWVQFGNDYVRQGRRNLDGYRMYYDLPETDPKKDHLSDLFDVTQVFDRERPVPVAPMS